MLRWMCTELASSPAFFKANQFYVEFRIELYESSYSSSFRSTRVEASFRSSDNLAFDTALRKHLAKLKPTQKAAFLAACNDLSPDGLLKSVRGLEIDQKRECRHSATVQKVLSIVEQLMSSVKIGMQSNPELSSLIVGATRLVIDMGVKYVTFLPKMVSMLSELSQYLDVLRLFVERLHNEGAPASDLVMKSVANIYGDWLDFCKEVQKVFVDKHGGLRRLVSIRIFLRVQWEPFEASFGPIKERFKENLQLLLHSSQAVQYNDMFAILEQLNAARSSQEERNLENTRRDFMQWICTIDFDEDHQRISSRKHPGTRDWLLQREDFRSWEASSTSQLLWCYGKPGCGKSVLASHTLEHVTWKAASNEQIGLAFCYFNYKKAEYQGPRQILAAFIKQLCWCKATIPSGVLGFYRKHILDARTPSYESMEEALSTMLDEFDEVYLVVDALDECKLELREQIIQSLVDASTNHPCVKTFVTSRPEVDIKFLFRKLNTPSVCIEAKNTANDIYKYVVDSVKSLREASKLRLQSEATATTIIDTLVSRADGMFLWVFLQLQNLCRQRIDRDILVELNRLPPDLNSTYYRILGVIEELPPSLRDLAQRSLMLVFYAARPLLVVELIDFAAVTAGFDDMQKDDMQRYTQDDILEACANLLVEDEGVIRPSHFSVQEYFTSNQPSEEQFSKYFVNAVEGHSQASTACLRYLLFDFLKGGVCGTEFSLAARLQRFPAARYSAQYFDYHLAMLEDHPTNLLDRLLKLLEQPSRFISAILQLRYMRKGSYTGVLTGDFDSMEWDVPPMLLLAITKLRSTQLNMFPEQSLELLDDVPCSLHLACVEGLESVFQEMVSQGRSIRQKSWSGLTPFYYGVKGGSTTICQQISSFQGSESWENFAPDFHVAFQPGNETLLRLLVTGIQDNRIISKAFEFAVQENAEAAIWIIVESLKANGRMQQSFIASILPELARRGSYHLAAKFEKIGWLEPREVHDPQAEYKINQALHWCCVRCDVRFMELLLNLGADLDEEIEDGIWGAARGITSDQTDEQIPFRQNMLFVSLCYQDRPTIELLLTRGARLNYSNWGSTHRTVEPPTSFGTDPDTGTVQFRRPDLAVNTRGLKAVNKALSSLGLPQLHPQARISHASAVVHFLLTAPYTVSYDTLRLLEAYDVIPETTNFRVLWQYILENARRTRSRPLKPYNLYEDTRGRSLEATVERQDTPPESDASSVSSDEVQVDSPVWVTDSDSSARDDVAHDHEDSGSNHSDGSNSNASPPVRYVQVPLRRRA